MEEQEADQRAEEVYTFIDILLKHNIDVDAIVSELTSNY